MRTPIKVPPRPAFERLESREVPALLAFAPVVEYDAGARPSAIESADINGDGLLDVLIPNSSSRDNGDVVMSLLNGRSDGTLAIRRETLSGTISNIFSADDFNEDGRIDVVTAIGAPGDLSLLLNTSDDLFSSRTRFSIGGTAHALMTDDFNDDGHMDIVATTTSGRMAVVLGTGSGTFGSPIIYPSGQQPWSIATGDFNQDNAVDIAVGDVATESITMFLGRGDGTFAKLANAVSVQRPSSIAVDDLNADGKLDLAVAGGDAHFVSVLIGNGDGSFKPTTTYSTGAESNALIAVDLDLDSHIDLAVAQGAARRVSVLRGVGNGEFSIPLWFRIAARSPGGLASGDFDGNGKPDLAVLSPETEVVSILRNISTEANQPPAPPVDVHLLPNSIEEGAGAGAQLPIIAYSSDGNGDNTVRYSLSDDANGRLQIDPITGQVTLGPGPRLDFETDPTRFQFAVRATDDHGQSSVASFSISVSNVPPMRPENIDPRGNGGVGLYAANGTPVGVQVFSTEPNNSTLTYFLANDVSGPFTISPESGIVTVAASHLLDANSTYHLVACASDGPGSATCRDFPILVVDLGSPDNVTLFPAAIAENLGPGAYVGELSSTDSDDTGPFVYSLVNGPGSDDNLEFEVVGSELRALPNLDYETKNNYSVRVRSTNSKGLFRETVFVIQILDRDEWLLDIELDKTTVLDSTAVGSVVGSFSTTYLGLSRPFSYTLVPGDGSEDNSRFELVGSELRTRVRLDELSSLELSIRVRSMDANGNRIERAIRITLLHNDAIWSPGDANRDGIFNSTDLILAFQVGEYEDRIAGNSVWADGDWNGDGEFDSGDIVFAFQSSFYVLDEVIGAIVAREELIDAAFA